MTLTMRYYDELLSTCENILRDYEYIQKKQSELDKKINDHYHYLEKAKFNAYEGFCLTNDLQRMVQERRLIKGEWKIMKELIEKIGIKGLQTKMNNNKKWFEAECNWRDNYTKDFKTEIDQIMLEDGHYISHESDNVVKLEVVSN